MLGALGIDANDVSAFVIDAEGASGSSDVVPVDEVDASRVLGKGVNGPGPPRADDRGRERATELQHDDGGAEATVPSHAATGAPSRRATGASEPGSHGQGAIKSRGLLVPTRDAWTASCGRALSATQTCGCARRASVPGRSA